jgi:RNA polymerase sigma-70 factor (ECF subfamily)
MAERRAIFLAHLASSRREAFEQLEELEARLEAIVVAGKSRRPELSFDESALVRHLAERLPADSSAAEALAKIRGDDLLLALACASGDPRAIGEFHRLHRAFVRRSLARFLPAEQVDEIAAEMMEHVLVSSESRQAAIRSYGGRGKWSRASIRPARRAPW